MKYHYAKKNIKQHLIIYITKNLIKMKIRLEVSKINNQVPQKWF